ncbi:hypothetical protein OSM86_24655, partial [Escherichia coli]|nr:hypothetical protein [Escherichia coli]
HGFEINARREAERTATTERARQQLDRTAVAENSGADERARARQLLDLLEVFHSLESCVNENTAAEHKKELFNCVEYCEEEC